MNMGVGVCMYVYMDMGVCAHVRDYGCVYVCMNMGVCLCV